MKRTRDEAMKETCDQLMERKRDHPKRKCVEAMERTREDWLQKKSLRQAMRTFFRLRTTDSLDAFVGQFEDCRDKTFKREIFQIAVKKSVQLDCADCFVQICHAQFAIYGYRKVKDPKEMAQEPDCVFAFTSLVNGKRLNMITETIEEKIYGVYVIYRKELDILVDTILRHKAWDILAGIFPVLREPFINDRRLIVATVDRCVHKLLADRSTWSGIAPVMDRWFSCEYNLSRGEIEAVMTYHRHTAAEVSSLKEWCVANGHFCLAFFLAVAIKDLPLVEKIATRQTRLNLKGALVRHAAFVVAKKRAFSSGAELLKHCPVTRASAVGCCSFPGAKMFAEACEDRGLLDWACVLQCCKRTHVRELLRQCSNQHVIDHVLMQAYGHGNLDLTWELLARCSHANTLQSLLFKAVLNSETELAEELLGRVDPSEITFFDYRKDDELKGLLVLASQCKPLPVKINMLRLMISSGLSTFLRDLPVGDRVLSYIQRSAVLWALKTGHFPTVKLILDSGAYSHQRLHRIRKSSRLQRYSTNTTKPVWKQGYKRMVEAAGTPSRLEHLARLAVSHSIGCQPGRAERIEALPVPKPLKDLVRFKDVLSAYKKDTKKDPAKDIETYTDEVHGTRDLTLESDEWSL